MQTKLNLIIVEIKSQNDHETSIQKRERNRMLNLGFDVWVVRGFDDVDKLIEHVLNVINNRMSNVKPKISPTSVT